MKKYTTLILSFSLILPQTAEQINQAKDYIKRTGMSEAQVRSAAKAQGLSDKKVNELILQEKKNAQKENDSTNDSFQIEPLSETNETSSIAKEINDKSTETDENKNSDDFKKIESKKASEDDNLKYFGYEIFERDPSLFQATSVGAVDPNYLIGPGDEIIVMLWGETQFRQVLTVDKEGFIFIPEIGQVFVNGLNLNLLESKLFKVLSQSYASLNPQGRKAATFLDVSLGNLRPLRVQVLGEVEQPGAYTVSPSTTLFSSLYYFNGPKELGSLRDIRLIRANNQVASIDFYDYLLTGKKPNDEKLQIDDIIFIPRRMKTISIVGEVNRPGIYELNEKETLSDLISMCGDLKITAYISRAQIDRIIPFKQREIVGMDRMIIDVNLNDILSDENLFKLHDGDKIKISSILEIRQNIVQIDGAITRPGNYEIKDSLKLSQLIKNADGVLGDVYFDRVDIIRTKPDFTKLLIKLDLKMALGEDASHDILLQPLDMVRVYGVTDMIDKKSASIEGHIKRPGTYTLFENMSINDLLFQAGGFLDSDFKSNTYLERADLIRLNDDKITSFIKHFNLGEILDNPDSKENILLKNGDLIRIYDKSLFNSIKPVSINGMVKRSGEYKYKTNMTLDDLIIEAGGFDNDLYRYKIDIARIDPKNEKLSEYADIISLTGENQSFIGGIDFLSKIKEFRLKPYDVISVRRDPMFKYHQNVKIEGEVLYPGDYTIINAEEKITDIIERAGGLLPNAYPEASSYYREGKKINISLEKILKNPKSNLNFEIQDGDRITIFPFQNVINIVGQVNNPGIHKYNKGKRLRYYLKLAGGLNSKADDKNIWINFPNGDSKRYSRWSILSPVVIDGATIHIGSKAEEEPFDRTEYVKEITAIMANIAQSIAVVILARN